MNGTNESRRWGVPIAVMVVLVLAGAASGATAATLITGKQIKDNTVASVDIRDNSLASVDVRNGSVTGTDIENGTIGKADLAAGATWSDVVVDGHLLSPTIPGTSLIDVDGTCVGYDARNTSVFGSITLPVGATITGFDATWLDQSADDDVQIGLLKRVDGVTFPVGTVQSGGSDGFGLSTSWTLNETVDADEQFFVTFIFPTAMGPVEEGGFCGMVVHLS
ncbi:MAG: hypothetical protein U0R80_00445 [Nocardioidaceae bacterium]